MADFLENHAYRIPGAERVESGVGRVDALRKSVTRLGASRVLVASSKSVVEKTPNVDRVQGALAGCAVEVFGGCRQHSPESDIEAMIVAIARHGADAVVSIGGSSIFDTVKIATSRHADRTGAEPIPQIAIPTTLSAGEFTYGAGYTEEETQSKKLALDPRVAPRIVVLDPEVTIDTPAELWLSSGIKALDHALEAVWAIRPHPYVEPLALEAIRLLFENLPSSRDPANLESRAACQFAAWMSISGAGASGMRLSHFLGHQIGARLHIPHGITSCILLPSVMRHLRDKTLAAQGRIAVAMGLSRANLAPEKLADAAADRLETFIADLGLPHSIDAAGGTPEDIDAITVASFAAATQLGLADDLPEGPESIRRILLGGG
ncbi:iron-containing alcohol dehydrogenase [Novosphingobium sp. Gsoil 351]|uniref:iron-containing alcohol dehydrogenase n=1 Tax=Novosphingobium sp. Gsoil 351 TaxID=2675225 RepID=UPI0018A802AF|nr:iron-containing alcohol dehydrogenase [Novosphingobium sp. Gsoil 351]